MQERLTNKGNTMYVIAEAGVVTWRMADNLMAKWNDDKKTNKDLQNTTHKAKDWATLH
jgi:hypothetical protein